MAHLIVVVFLEELSPASPTFTFKTPVGPFAMASRVPHFMVATVGNKLARSPEETSEA